VKLNKQQIDYIKKELIKNSDIQEINIPEPEQKEFIPEYGMPCLFWDLGGKSLRFFNKKGSNFYRTINDLPFIHCEPAWWYIMLFAPDWANYAAMNIYNDWYYIKEFPYISNDTYWGLGGQYSKTHFFIHPDYRNSLVSRDDIPEQFRR
jgi:hypothetical protein